MKKSKREKQGNEDKGVCSPMLICLERWKEREAGDVGTCLNVHECLAMLICPEKEREKGGRGFRQTYMDVKEWSPMITWPEREEEGGLGFMYVLFNANLEKEGVQQSLYEFVWVFLRRRRGLFQVSTVTVLFISTSSIVNWMFFSSFTGPFFSLSWIVSAMRFWVIGLSCIVFLDSTATLRVADILLLWLGL